MKVAVIGLGAIGGLVAAYLKSKGVDVVTVGRLEQKKQIERLGLAIEGVRGTALVYTDVQTRLEEKVDLAILTVKTQDLRDAVDKSRDFLVNGPLILSTQNGVRADKLLGMMLGPENLVSSIVMFGATYVPYHRVVHNFEGNWLIGRPSGRNDEAVARIVDVLKVAFEAVPVENIAGMKWTKVFVNASNCIPAVLGKSMQETYADPAMCGWALKILKEGFDVVDALKIELLDMPGFEVQKLKGLASMPVEQAAPIYSGIMTKLSGEPLYGSILQSIQRGRPSEIDFVNGEFANQAKTHGIDAKLNTRITELVHKVEASKTFLTHEELNRDLERMSQAAREDFF
ncbi:MAG: ketopantoate reductase family protein [Deltaproteobacteria bacterium]